jgi:hypothetical protein
MPRRALGVLIAAIAIATPAEGGHELPIYPSFYPHEIRIETIDPDAAARLLLAGEIQAYVGAEPRFAAAPGDKVSAVESIGSFVLVAVDPPDCGALQAAARDLPAGADGIVFHPYPITPFHADYLQHADRVEAAKQRARGAAPARRDAGIERVDAAALVAAATTRVNGWLGPPWLKSGWFQAYRLLADALDPADRPRADDALRRLQQDDFDGVEERLNVERTLLSVLTGNCRRAVAGYTVKREWFNAEFSAGVENIAADSEAGFGAPVFIRTVKLKDFPWNGWLRLGIATRPDAAWNPLAGFSDPAGRLIWSALGDPAAFPAPYGDGWVLNRIADVKPLR